jgi:hypothetical protein
MHAFSNYSLPSLFPYLLRHELDEGKMQVQTRKICSNRIHGRSNIGTESTRMFFIRSAKLFCCNLICTDDLILFNMFMRERRQTCRLRFLKHIECQCKITYLKMKNSSLFARRSTNKSNMQKKRPLKYFIMDVDKLRINFVHIRFTSIA